MKITPENTLVVGTGLWRAHSELTPRMVKLDDYEYGTIRRHFNHPRTLTEDPAVMATVKDGWSKHDNIHVATAVRDAAHKVARAAVNLKIEHLIYTPDKGQVDTYQELLIRTLVDLKRATISHRLYDGRFRLTTYVVKIIK